VSPVLLKLRLALLASATGSELLGLPIAERDRVAVEQLASRKMERPPGVAEVWQTLEEAVPPEMMPPEAVEGPARRTGEPPLVVGELEMEPGALMVNRQMGPTAGPTVKAEPEWRRPVRGWLLESRPARTNSLQVGAAVVLAHPPPLAGHS